MLRDYLIVLLRATALPLPLLLGKPEVALQLHNVSLVLVANPRQESAEGAQLLADVPKHLADGLQALLVLDEPAGGGLLLDGG